MLKMDKSKIEINEQFQKALDLIENTDKHIFITGRAGTGKSTLLNYARSITKKKIAVLAPTGVAAVNINGQTIHSFFGFKPDITVSKIKKISGSRKNIYKKIDAIIIDEVSMVRADLLDCVDVFLWLNGKKKKDEKFIGLLNSIRNNTATPGDLALLNERFDSNFKSKADDFYVYLTTTNDLSRQINDEHLEKIKSDSYYFSGRIKGDFEEKYLPTDVGLELKIEAQVMLLNNDSQGRWINGSIGKIIDIEKSDDGGADMILVELDQGETVEVAPYEWTIYSYAYNSRLNILETETIGSFTQYPLKLAWSFTIHKSQGKTFPKVIIDIGRGTFAHGQMYVALSRCVSLEGLVLKKEIKKHHIFIDSRVVDFVTKYQYKISDQKMPLKQKVEMIKKAIENSRQLEIVYLRDKDERSERVITPSFVGDLEFTAQKFLGMKGFCHTKGEDMVFKVDRILEMKEIL